MISMTIHVDRVISHVMNQAIAFSWSISSCSVETYGPPALETSEQYHFLVPTKQKSKGSLGEIYL